MKIKDFMKGFTSGWTLLLVAGIVAAVAADTITTSGARVIIDPAKGLDVDELYSSTVLQLIPSGDTSDYLELQTVSDRPGINIVGSDWVVITQDDDNNGELQINVRDDYLGFNLDTNDSDGTDAVSFYAFSQHSGTLPQDLRIYNRMPSGDIVFMTNEDTDDYGVMNTATNVFSFSPNTDDDGTLGTDSKRWADVKAVLVKGSDYCFENDVCMTEWVNDQGQVDIAFVYGLPTEEQRKKMAVFRYATYGEYISGQMINATHYASDAFTEQEFNTIKSEITVNGKPDFTFGRQVRMSLREVKHTIERVNALEATLCGEGHAEYC